MPRNGIAESYGNCMCKFLRNCFPQWLHHLDSYEEYFKLMNTVICAFGGNKQSSMLRSTQGLNCWVLLCSDVELWLNAASFPEPAVRQLCEVLAVRSSLVLAVLAVLSIRLLLNAASLRIKIPPHPTFKASASWAYAPQGRATLCCWPSPGVELAQPWCGAGPGLVWSWPLPLLPGLTGRWRLSGQPASSASLQCKEWPEVASFTLRSPQCLPSTMGSLSTSQPTWL